MELAACLTGAWTESRAEVGPLRAWQAMPTGVSMVAAPIAGPDARDPR